MRDYSLGFISNDDIYNHVKETVEQYRTVIDLQEFNKNLIDPIKLTFDAKVYGMSFEEVIQTESVRQIDKTNTNKIGYFHQNIFRYAPQGWDVPEQGWDVEDDQACCMLVEVIANKSQNIKWTVSVDGRSFSHEQIRRVSIDKFYELVFNDATAFMRLCKALPDILDDVLEEMQRGYIQSSVYSELNSISTDTFKSLYLLAFRTYEGFDDFIR